MKRFRTALFAFLLILVTSLTTSAYSQSDKTLSQGIYNARDSNLLIGTPMTVKIDFPSGKAIIFILDSDYSMKEMVKLESESTEHTLKPFDYGSLIIVVGNSSVTFF
ncbi:MULTISPECIES: hypothetical protein [Clostridium]|jgi:hypothetical protein|uniref:Uncharacterized protein n=1 Tax=Clostridium beijerinckii TaxID=1520 RepID=A0A7X9SS51_CLOBE|nr:MULTISPECIES: hypothetical protein [Clostridium]MBC2456671.1 hypothetical protein [Clostridium beijerinckii]MBC2473971.1 hypothetical protein [Clostridium beijerinckii]MCI1578051.1 hypothetical protein [Clostridium beijerinckii]MCI1583066.1 hypothetical protein [Clostridium beijerinckii]MCI1620808.1 hypothetical protein [Clostridium beijerinckii]